MRRPPHVTGLCRPLSGPDEHLRLRSGSETEITFAVYGCSTIIVTDTHTVRITISLLNPALTFVSAGSTMLATAVHDGFDQTLCKAEPCTCGDEKQKPHPGVLECGLECTEQDAITAVPLFSVSCVERGRASRRASLAQRAEKERCGDRCRPTAVSIERTPRATPHLARLPR